MGLPWWVGLIVFLIVVVVGFRLTNYTNESMGWFKHMLSVFFLVCLVIGGGIFSIWIAMPPPAPPHMETNMCQLLWHILNPASDAVLPSDFCTETNIQMMVETTIKPINGVNWNDKIIQAINGDWDAKDEDLPRTRDIVSQYWGTIQQDQAVRLSITGWLPFWLIIWVVLRSLLIWIKSKIKSFRLPIWIFTVVASAIVYWLIFKTQYGPLDFVIGLGLSFAILLHIGNIVLMYARRGIKGAGILLVPYQPGMGLLASFAAVIMPTLNSVVIANSDLRMTSVLASFVIAYVGIDALITAIQGMLPMP